MSVLDDVRALLQPVQPDTLERIHATVQAAICDGDPQAHLLMSVLCGAGVGAPQDWTAALDHLRAAALAGSDTARAQLRLLGDAAPADDWPALRASIRVDNWLAPSVKQVLSTAPRVVTIDGFLSPAVCDWAISRARGRTDRAKVFDVKAGAAADDAGRSNTAFEFSFLELDLVVLLIRARIAATIGFPVTAFEPTQVLRYETGQRFARHHDYLDPKLAGHAAEIARRGQRAVTFLIYLNDAFEAGDTHFPMIGVRRRCPTGGALYFGNVDTAGVPDPRTLHEGTAPTRGEKWLLSQWIRIQAVA
jgi:prolyl 4-hydroxylase